MTALDAFSENISDRIVCGNNNHHFVFDIKNRIFHIQKQQWKIAKVKNLDENATLLIIPLSAGYTIPTISLIHFLTVYEKFLKISIVLLRLLHNVKWTCSEQQLYIIL